MNTKEIFKFLISGALAAGVNFGSRFIFSTFMEFQCAVISAYLVGMAIAFWLFRTRVFKDGRTNIRQATFRFLVVNIFGMLLIWTASAFVLQVIGVSAINEAIAHLFGISFTTVTSYFGHRFYTFKR